MKTVPNMTHDLAAVVRFVTDYARDNDLIRFDPKTKIKVKALDGYDGNFCWHRNVIELDASLSLEEAVTTLLHELKHSEQRFEKRRTIKVAAATGVLTPHWLGIAIEGNDEDLSEEDYMALPWEVEAFATEFLAPVVINAFRATQG